jgi:hypothetical protein
MIQAHRMSLLAFLISPDLAGLSTAVGRGGLWRYQRSTLASRSCMETRHRAF